MRRRPPGQHALGVELGRRVDERGAADDRLARRHELALDGLRALEARRGRIGVGDGDDRRLVEALEQPQPRPSPVWSATVVVPGAPATRATQQARPPLRKKPRTACASFAPARNGPCCGLGGVGERRGERLEGLRAHRVIERAGGREARECGDRGLDRGDPALGQRQGADVGYRGLRVAIGRHRRHSVDRASNSPCPFVRPSVPCGGAARPLRSVRAAARRAISWRLSPRSPSRRPSA